MMNILDIAKKCRSCYALTNKIPLTQEQLLALVQDAVTQTFGLPRTWRLVAQMPFGCVLQPPAQKDYLPLEQRVHCLQ